MTDVLIAKLEQFAPLSQADQAVLRDSVAEVTQYAVGDDIISEGARPDLVHLLLEGWAGRYKLLENGDRHIMAFLIPGDLCDVHIALLDVMDHSIGALSPCKVATYPRDSLAKLMVENGRIASALMWATLVDEAILREWLVNVGARQADKRVGHLLCEMLFRSRAVGLSADNSFEVPLTQQQLADSMGMSSVHMNRTLQELKSQGFIAQEGRRLVVEKLEALIAFSDFDPIYLHQARNRTAIAAAERRAS